MPLTAHGLPPEEAVYQGAILAADLELRIRYPPLGGELVRHDPLLVGGGEEIQFGGGSADDLLLGISRDGQEGLVHRR